MSLFSKFIETHAHEDPAKLILSKDKYPDIDIKLAVNTITGRKKLRTKVPLLYNNPELIYPNTLCTEQCSSAETAEYKAALASRICNHHPSSTIADLTGGLGVDSIFFSKYFHKVLYNEMNPSLANAFRHNIEKLQIHNISIRQEELSLQHPASSILEDFHPDIIFIDPARRSSSGRKVFLPEECTPDVLSLQDDLSKCCPLLLLKLSPMADISLLQHKFRNIKEIHIITSAGECKELLLLIDFNSHIPATLHIYENGKSHIFHPEIEKNLTPVLPKDSQSLPGFIGRHLIEAGKSISKAGLFNTFCRMSNSIKLGHSTHLYFSSDTADENAFQDGISKTFRILDILPLNNPNLKATGKKYPNAEVSAKNIHLSSDELRKKLHCKSGENIHIFGAKIDFITENSKNYLIIATPMQ